MNIDKHDLFRNVIPGYVFLTVITSFPIILGHKSLEEIVDGKFGLVSLSIVGGFPIGYLLYSTYRIMFHVWCCEQRRMEKGDVGIIKHIIGDEPKIKNSVVLANIMIFGLMNSKNKAFNRRLDYLMSLMHSLGASCWAIFCALITVIISYEAYKVGLSSWFGSNFRLSMIFLFWMAILWILFRSRLVTKRNYLIARETFANIESQKIRGAYEAHVKVSQDTETGTTEA